MHEIFLPHILKKWKTLTLTHSHLCTAHNNTTSAIVIDIKLNHRKKKWHENRLFWFSISAFSIRSSRFILNNYLAIDSIVALRKNSQISWKYSFYLRIKELFWTVHRLASFIFEFITLRFRICLSFDTWQGLCVFLFA